MTDRLEFSIIFLLKIPKSSKIAYVQVDLQDNDDHNNDTDSNSNFSENEWYSCVDEVTMLGCFGRL